MSIAFWIVTLLLLLIIKTNNLIWLGFLVVYGGVDAVCTILHRIYLKENIFEAHRLHFYEILANDQGIPHRLISVIYTILQLLCSALIFKFYPTIGWWVLVILLVVLLALYSLKFKLMTSKK